MIRCRGFIFVCLFICLSAGNLFSEPGKIRLLFIGDSLTAGLGVMPEQAYPALIQKRFDRQSPGSVQVINGGISGSTSAGAKSRLKWYLRAKPDILVLALGANDGLRGLPVDEMKKNLAEAIILARENQIRVLLCGMEVPPNYGPAYAADFRRVFGELADEYHLPLMPFLLKGVGGETHLNQADGIHPTAQGHEIIARHLFDYVKELL